MRANLAKIILEDDEPREILVHTCQVQQQGLVLVVEARDNESNGRPVGPATLVAFDTAIRRVDHRDTTSTLLPHVLVPVAAGGDRDEHKTKP